MRREHEVNGYLIRSFLRIFFLHRSSVKENQSHHQSTNQALHQRSNKGKKSPLYTQSIEGASLRKVRCCCYEREESERAISPKRFVNKTNPRRAKERCERTDRVLCFIRSALHHSCIHATCMYECNACICECEGRRTQELNVRKSWYKYWKEEKRGARLNFTATHSAANIRLAAAAA